MAAAEWAGRALIVTGHFGLVAGVQARERFFPLWALMLATVWLDVIFDGGPHFTCSRRSSRMSLKKQQSGRLSLRLERRTLTLVAGLACAPMAAERAHVVGVAGNGRSRPRRRAGMIDDERAPARGSDIGFR